jgi:methionyl-tRNA formyltransferase
MTTIYISSLQIGKECLKLIKETTKIDHVVTIDQHAAERAHVSGYSDFNDTGLPIHYLNQYSMKNHSDFQLIHAMAPDVIIVNGWNRLIPKAILDIPRYGCVGFHGSWNPLPFGRGRSPITWAILNNAKRFFLHLLYLDEGVDSGDIIDTIQFDITAHDTCTTVFEKAAITSARLLSANLPKILDGTASRTPQTGAPVYLPKRTPDGGLIDWSMSLDEICNLVRAVTRPYGGAFSAIDYAGKRVKINIWDAVPFSYDINFEGEVGVIVHELHGKPLIKCRNGIMLVKDFTIGTL